VSRHNSTMALRACILSKEQLAALQPLHERAKKAASVRGVIDDEIAEAESRWCENTNAGRAAHREWEDWSRRRTRAIKRARESDTTENRKALEEIRSQEPSNEPFDDGSKAWARVVRLRASEEKLKTDVADALGAYVRARSKFTGEDEEKNVKRARALAQDLDDPFDDLDYVLRGLAGDNDEPHVVFVME